MFTSHGHHIPTSPLDGERPPLARCGGPRFCHICKIEVADYIVDVNGAEATPKVETVSVKVDLSPAQAINMKALEIAMSQAREGASAHEIKREAEKYARFIKTGY